MKISIIGSGKVGAAIGYTAAMQGLSHEIVMVDAFEDKAHGEALDILQCQAFAPQCNISWASVEETAGSDIVVITAGIPRKADEPRVLLLSRNAALIADLVEKAVAASPNCILFLVTNPLDVMTQLAYTASKLPAQKVIGMGTVLDTARYRSHLAARFALDARDISAYVVGEHGETMVPLTSGITVRGIPLEQMPGFCAKALEEIKQEVIAASGQVIALKGGTVFAPAVSACTVLAAIVNDTHSILPVCTYNPTYGVAVSMPTLVDRRGAHTVFDLAMTDTERQALKKSVENIKNYAADLKDYL